jgi:1-acyl-sn-glycerol-3-phosphate acyltransferase
MRLLRSALQNIFFFTTIIVVGVVCLPGAYISRSFARDRIRFAAHTLLWSLRVFSGLDYKVIGARSISKNPALYASQHQSMWETAALYLLVPNGVFIVKKSLINLPVAGVYLRRSGFIGVDRSNKSILRGVIKKCLAQKKQGFSIILFPEGHRIPHGEQAHLNPSFAMIAQEAGLSVIPITHNSGHFFPKRSFFKKSGVIKMEVHKPLSMQARPIEMVAELKTIYYGKQAVDKE